MPWVGLIGYDTAAAQSIKFTERKRVGQNVEKGGSRAHNKHLEKNFEEKSQNTLKSFRCPSVFTCVFLRNITSSITKGGGAG